MSAFLPQERKRNGTLTEEERRGERGGRSGAREGLWTFVGELEAVIGDLEKVVLGVVDVPAARRQRRLLAYGRHGWAGWGWHWHATPSLPPTLPFPALASGFSL